MILHICVNDVNPKLHVHLRHVASFFQVDGPPKKSGPNRLVQCTCTLGFFFAMDIKRYNGRGPVPFPDSLLLRE